jgi:hypothetical protein
MEKKKALDKVDEDHLTKKLCHQGREIITIIPLEMVHFALFLVKISINFRPGYITLFFPHHSGRLYFTKISKL